MSTVGSSVNKETKIETVLDPSLGLTDAMREDGLSSQVNRSRVTGSGRTIGMASPMCSVRCVVVATYCNVSTLAVRTPCEKRRPNQPSTG